MVNMKTKKKIEYLFFYWLPVLTWAAVIFTFSSFPTGTTSRIDWQDFIIKKTAHVVVYFVLTSLSYRALIRSGMDKIKAAKIAIIASVIYGFSDEYHQSFTPGRDPRLRDVLFDTIGAFLSIYVIWSLLPKAPKKLKKLAKDSGLI